jgi:hypothetical protein
LPTNTSEPNSSHIVSDRDAQIIFGHREITIASGKLTDCELENGNLELIYQFKMVIFHGYVSLPEGILTLGCYGDFM